MNVNALIDRARKVLPLPSETSHEEINIPFKVEKKPLYEEELSFGWQTQPLAVKFKKQRVNGEVTGWQAVEIRYRTQ